MTVDGAPLDWRSSLAVRNHSPTGPAWGYAEWGPAQLPLAILLAVTNEATAERFCQKFKWDVLAPIEADHWMLDTGHVLRLAGVGSGGNGRCRAPGGGDVSSRRLAGCASAGVVSGTAGDGGGSVPGLPDAVRRRCASAAAASTFKSASTRMRGPPPVLPEARASRSRCTLA